MAFTGDEYPGSTLDPKWAWINQGGATATVANGQLKIQLDDVGDTLALAALVQPYTGAITVSAHIHGGSARYTAFQQWGLVLADAGERLLAFSWISLPTPALYVIRYTSPTASPDTQLATPLASMGGYLQVEDDGTDLIFRVSRPEAHAADDSLVWQEIYREDRTDSFPAGPTGIGYVIEARNADALLLSSWIREGEGAAPESAEPPVPAPAVDTRALVAGQPWPFKSQSVVSYLETFDDPAWWTTYARETDMGKLADWFRHPSSTPALVAHLQLTGGPLGGIGNALRFDCSATAAKQCTAYVNTRLGPLRGEGLFTFSTRFSADADRCKSALVVRWASARLDAVDLGYAVELQRDGDDIRYVLRSGPGEAGAVMKSGLLDPDYGFAEALWIDAGVILTTDVIGNLKIQTIVRSNGAVSGHDSFEIADDSWYTLGSVKIDRYAKRDRGHVGWQVISRAGAGYVEIGHLRVEAEAFPNYTILDDVVVVPG